MADNDQFDYSGITKQYEDISAGYEQMAREKSAGYGYPVSASTPPAGWSGSYSTPRGNLITIGTPPAGIHDRGRSGVSTQPSRSTYGGGQETGQPASESIPLGYRGPTVAKPQYTAPKFDAPDKYRAPEYKPPERDEGEERRLRSEYMAPGMRQVRRTTQESILSSKSFDNPNARSMFIQKALEGVGGAVSQVAGTAGREASREATQRYNTTLQNYYNKFSSLTDEAKTNYSNKWQKALMDYQGELAGAQAEYQTQAAMFSQMPLAQQAGASGGGSPTGSQSGYTGDPRGYNKWYEQTYG